jgi:hypothetical protein
VPDARRVGRGNPRFNIHIVFASSQREDARLVAAVIAASLADNSIEFAGYLQEN